MDPVYLQYVPAATTERGRREVQGLSTQTARIGRPAAGRKQASGVCGWVEASLPASLSGGFQPCPCLIPRGMKYLRGIFSIAPSMCCITGARSNRSVQAGGEQRPQPTFATASLTVTPAQQTIAGEGKIRPRDSAGKCPSKAKKSMQKLSRG